ncbi:hypothetical protein BB561_000429 [Smittium simulii]|uniref:COP9 signalosome complex subunit 4 n=1 Tax=Smittium simulii TaxID=133385 RepID=A0A2T9YZ57_9FUNG|nr:hypothetical protein BB561_000429 [Smittium simulii]
MLTQTLLQSIASITDQNARKEAIIQLCKQLIATNDNSESCVVLFKKYLEYSLETRDTLISQEFILEFTKKLINDNTFTDVILKEILLMLISQLKTKEKIYNESSILAGKKLIEIYKMESDWISTSNILETIPHVLSERNDCANYTVDQQKMEIYIKAGESFRLVNNIPKAESFLGRAGQFLKSVGEKHRLIYDFKFFQAKMFDTNRVYTKAYSIYIELIINRYDDVNTRLDLLNMATKNLILSEPSNKKTQTLERIINTKISAIMPLRQIAEKVLQNCIIFFDNFGELKYGSAVLDLYNLLTIAPGFKPNNASINESSAIQELNRFFCKHNIFCLSQTFANISFEILSKLTRVDMDYLENNLIQMINDNSLKAYIDGVDELIIFSDYNPEDEILGSADLVKSQFKSSDRVLENLSNFDLEFEEIAIDKNKFQFHPAKKEVILSISDIINSVEDTKKKILQHYPNLMGVGSEN